MLSLADYSKIFVALLVILDPLVAVPTFINLTTDESHGKRSRIAFVTAVAVFILLSAATFAGAFVLRMFGVSISAFRVGGGILILLMGISMLQARIHASKQTPEETLEAEDKETIAVVPLAIPLLAGPGSLSMMIVYSHQAPEILHKLVLVGIALLVSVIVWLVLLVSNRIGKALGKTGINISNRLVGLLLAGIGAQFIAEGLKGLFPSLR